MPWPKGTRFTLRPRLLACGTNGLWIRFDRAMSIAHVNWHTPQTHGGEIWNPVPWKVSFQLLKVTQARF